MTVDLWVGMKAAYWVRRWVVMMVETRAEMTAMQMAGQRADWTAVCSVASSVLTKAVNWVRSTAGRKVTRSAGEWEATRAANLVGKWIRTWVPMKADHWAVRLG
jgi:hypothetical protein